MKNGVAVGQNNNCTFVYKCKDGTEAIAKIVMRPKSMADDMLEKLEKVD